MLAKCTVDTITFLPYYIEMLKTISKKAVLDWIKDLTKLLRGSKLHLPHELYKDKTLTALDKINDIFKPILNIPSNNNTLDLMVFKNQSTLNF